MSGDALSLLSGHFERMGRRQFEVPEVTDPATGGPLTIHYTPVTVGEMAKIRRKGRDNEAMLALWVVILKAQDAAGKRLFDETATTVQVLSESVSADILGAIAKEIMGDRAEGRADLGN